MNRQRVCWGFRAGQISGFAPRVAREGPSIFAKGLTDPKTRVTSLDIEGMALSKPMVNYLDSQSGNE